MKKTVYLILIICLVISALGLQSCKDDERNRESFSPESGAYEIMLNPEEWIVLSMSSDYLPNQLVLFCTDDEFLLTDDCYSKAGLSDVGVSSLDSFIEFYKTFDNGKSIYASSDEVNKTIDSLTELAKKDIKKSDIKTGKRQTIHFMSDEEHEILKEIVYLEAENYFLAISYDAFAEKFTEAQKSVNDLIAHIKID